MAVRARRRGRRRPRWFLIGALLSLVVITVNAAISAQSDERGQRLAQLGYLDQVRPHIERSTDLGAELTEVRDQAGALRATGVRRRLAQLREEADQILRTVRATEPPDTLLTAHNLLLTAMTVRARAVTDLQEALEQALSGRATSRSLQDLVSDVGDDIVAADQTYRVFLESLPPPRELRAPPLPQSRWAEDSDLWSGAELAALVSAVRAGATDAVRHDVAIVVVRTDPAPVAREGEAAVLPLMRGLRVEVVVANTGNQPERRVPVVATLRAPSGRADTARDFVDLAPGQRRVVNLGGLQPVAGPPSTLSVVIGPVEGEDAIADNGYSVQLVYRG